jgi:transposase-like protein
VCRTWRYVDRAVNHYGQVIDVFLSKKRDLEAAEAF